MAYGTVQERVQDLVGTEADTAFITDAVNDSIRELVNAVPKRALWKMSNDFTDAGSGIATDSLRVLYGHKSGYAAIEKKASEYARYADSASLLLATAKSPIMYKMNDKVYIKPSGGTVVAVKYPTSITFASTTIAGFPDDLEHLVILKTAIHVRLRQLTDKRTSIPSDLTLPTALTAPSAPTITYTDATGGDASATVVTTVAVGVAPGVATVTVGSAPTVGTEVVGSLGTPPTYVKPTVSPDWTQLETFLETDGIVELSSVQMERINAELQKFGIDVQNEGNEFQMRVEAYDATIQEAIKNADIASQRVTSQAQLDMQETLKQADVDIADAQKEADFAMQRILKQGDIEMAKAQKDADNATQVDIRNKAQAQALNIELKSKDLQKQIEQWRADLGLFSAKVQDYGAQTGAMIQNYGAKFQRYAGEHGQMLTELKGIVEQYNNGLKLFMARS